MSRTSLTIITILVLGAATAGAETFNPSPYLAEAGGRADQARGQRTVRKNLFGDPYATVGWERRLRPFSYLEARYFQIAPTRRGTASRWAKWAAARSPRRRAEHLRLAAARPASDGRGRCTADTDATVCSCSTASEFDRMELQPLYAVEGLAGRLRWRT
jgi:hypothetical protein